MKKVLVTGGSGKFAKALSKIKSSNYDFFYLGRADLDVTNTSSLETKFNERSPDIVIHSGALTRPMEKHRLQPIDSISTNIVGTANVVIECIKRNIKLVYISTDYVYPGISGNYRESDPVYPVNEYAWSKLGGECAVRLYENSLILRIAMFELPFPHTHALNDVKKSAITQDLAAEICVKLLDQRGVINVGGKEETIYDFVKQHDPSIRQISKDVVKNVNMPSNSSMNLENLENILCEMEKK